MRKIMLRMKKKSEKSDKGLKYVNMKKRSSMNF